MTEGDRCRVCTTPLLPSHVLLEGAVCKVCRPAYDAGRRAGMEYCLAVITARRDEPSGQLITALRAAMPSSRRQPVQRPADAMPDKPRRKPHLRSVQLLPSGDATPPDMLSSLLAETPMTCTSCCKVAHVTGEERRRGRWTCYGCGLVNRVTA